MNLKIVALVIIAMMAAIGAVTTLTSISLVQQAEANACNFNFKVGSYDCSKNIFTDPAGDNIHSHVD
jgi:hypothetical protein